MRKQLLITTLLASITLVASAEASVVTWSGQSIVGESASYKPTGSATFSISGNTLCIVLTDTTALGLGAPGRTLTGLTWDIIVAGVTLTPGTALIDTGSRLVGTGAGTATYPTDLSGEWAFRDDLSASGIGAHGISAVGSMDYVGTFGPHDLFDPTKNQFPPPSGSPNGIEGGILGPNADVTQPNFGNQGPLVQGYLPVDPSPGQMKFTFTFTGLLSASNVGSAITNVKPFFGSDGKFLIGPQGQNHPIPEPGAIITWLTLLAAATVSWGLRRRRSVAAV